ncbi:hypothetical protein [Rhodoplanes roseus]|uniref:hypothetical protein n=1 Tax=Rhodoplanes roseus TaxID=29409 RepID=UPI0011B4E9FC|nr:hypothetical protein [Rhodoplanes roseus]
MTERIQCRHCDNPDRDHRPCRWTWWQPWLRNNEAYTPPCEFDREDEGAARARRAANRNTVVFLVFVAVVTAGWWAMTRGIEWMHLHMWMGPGLRP